MTTEQPSNPMRQERCLHLKSIMLSPPFSKAPQTTVLSLSQRPCDESFLRHKNLNNILFTWVRTGSGTTNACIICTNCEINLFFYHADFASSAQVSFFPCINYSFNVFHPSHPVFFNLRSTFITGKLHTKNCESPLPYKSKKGVSAVLFITEPHCLWFHPIYFQAWECGKLSQNVKCLLHILLIF